MNKPSDSRMELQFRKSRIENARLSYVHPPLGYENALLEAIRFGNEDKAMRIMGKINELEGATLADYPLRSKKNALIASCTLYTRAIIKAGVDPETSFQLSDAFIQQIERIGDFARLSAFEYEMLLQFIAVMKREKQPLSYSHIVNLSIHYIREHIFQEFTLQIIADHVGVHPSYLSDRFRKETGETVTTYINRRKIEESKHFLIYTNQSITDIAFLFKYSSQSYYTHIFKKFTGMTPKDFRKTGAAE